MFVATTAQSRISSSAENVLLQTCVELKKTSLWINTFIPITLTDPGSFEFIHCCSGDEKRMGIKDFCLFFFFFFLQELPG